MFHFYPTNTRPVYYVSIKLQKSNLSLAYEAFLDFTNNKNVLFVIILASDGIKRNHEKHVPNSYQGIFLSNFLRFSRKEWQVIEIMDLIEHVPSDSKSLFFECDEYWNLRYNLWAENIISQLNS